MLDCLHNIPPYNDRLYACEGPGATLTPQACLNAVSSSRSCYWDGYEQRWTPYSSICNGALIIGPRGARCRAYCDGINKLSHSFISQWFTCVTRYCSNPEFSLLHLSLAERLCCKQKMNTKNWYVSECYWPIYPIHKIPIKRCPFKVLQCWCILMMCCVISQYRRALCIRTLPRKS